MSTPLIIDDAIRAQLHTLRKLAEANPVDMPPLLARLTTPEGKAAHKAQMTQQSVEIPLAYLVTFSIERDHPCGTCRHMSMSVAREGRVPNEFALWMVAAELGFWGSLKECTLWSEHLLGHGVAINVVQPQDAPPPA